MSEYAMQCEVAAYLREKRLLFTSTAGGIAHKKHQLIRMTRSGYEKGVPDLAVFEARGSYHGLFIEMKTPVGRLSPYQRAYIKRLNENGFMATTCFSVTHAKDVIDQYVALPSSSDQ